MRERGTCTIESETGRREMVTLSDMLCRGGKICRSTGAEGRVSERKAEKQNYKACLPDGVPCWSRSGKKGELNGVSWVEGGREKERLEARR